MNMKKKYRKNLEKNLEKIYIIINCWWRTVVSFNQLRYVLSDLICCSLDIRGSVN